MKINYLLMLLFGFGFAHAEDNQTLVLQAKESLHQYAPDREFHEYAMDIGYLNSDDIPDFAAFIGDPNYNERGVEDLKIVVFLGTKDGSFKFYDSSSAIFGHERVTHALTIYNDSLFLSRDGSGGCCSHWVEKFQFKMRNEKLMLIGLETASFYTEEANETDSGTSANLVTGKIMKWTQKDQVKHSGEKTKVAGLKPVPFHEFNYETFSDQWVMTLWQ